MTPCVSVSRKLTVFAGFAAALTLAGASHAATRAPNYKFDDGAAGFSLQTRGGPVNPGVWVGFNPQPDPPGDVGITALNAYKPSSLDLSNAYAPVFFADRKGASFLIELYDAFGDGSVRPLDKPNSDGLTRFEQSFGGHNIIFTFQFGDGGGAGFGDGGGAGFGEGGGAGRWFGADPQSHPPGDGVAAQFTLPTGNVRPTAFDAAGPRDLFVRISATVDGQALSFSATPEPATWAFMIMGLGGAGAVLRRRRTLAAQA